MNYYELLGVHPDATLDEIRLAYRELAKKFHPDGHYTYIKKAWATGKMQEINAAYTVLRDPIKRMAYDQERKLAFDEGRPNSNQKMTKGSSTFWSMVKPSWAHPYRSWMFLLFPVYGVVFAIVQLDSILEFNWLTTGKGGLTNHAVLAAMITILFFANPILLVFVLPLIGLLTFLVAIPLVAVSEGLKLGLRRKTYKTNDDPRKLIIDGSVRVGSLIVLIVLAMFFPQVAILFFAAFPYNLFLLFGVAVWIGELMALGLFFYRSRKISKTTEMLLATT